MSQSQNNSSRTFQAVTSPVRKRPAQASTRHADNDQASPQTTSPSSINSSPGHQLASLSIVPSAATSTAAAVQTKLTVGEANDQYEREADHIADKVMGMQLPVTGSGDGAVTHQGGGAADSISSTGSQPSAAGQAQSIQNKPLSITPWVQRQTETSEEDETLQAKVLIQRQQQQEDEEEEAEEETLQAKTLIQRQTDAAGDKEEEELVQSQSLIQRQEEVEEEEETLQQKGLIQRQGDKEQNKDEEDSSLQAKSLIQRQAEEADEEEEETLQAKLLLQRQAGKSEEEEQEEEAPVQAKSSHRRAPSVSSELESKLNRSQGGGQALSESSRGFFEPRFGHDFSQVRIHADGEASQAAQSLNAQAFTRGNDIYFGAGRYQPNSKPGQQLLAHELTHTVQQTGGSTLSPATSVARKPNDSSPKPSPVDSISSIPHTARGVISRKENPAATSDTPVFNSPAKTPTKDSRQGADQTAANQQATDQATEQTGEQREVSTQAATETSPTQQDTTQAEPLIQGEPGATSGQTEQAAASGGVATTGAAQSTTAETAQATTTTPATAEPSSETLPADTEPGGLIDTLTNAPATRALERFNQVHSASQQSLQNQTTALQDGLPKVNTPTGLAASEPKAKQKQEDKTPTRAADFDSEQSGSAGRDPNALYREPTRVNVKANFSRADRLSRAASQGSGNEAASTSSAINAIDVPVSRVPDQLGPTPQVNLSGEADPGQADAFQQESTQQVAQASAESRQLSQQDFGEQAISPAPDNSVLESKQALQTVSPSGEALEASQPIPEEVRGDIDQSMGASLSPALQKEQQQYQQAQTQFETDKQQAEQDNQEQREQLEEQTRQEQLKAREDAGKQVDENRKEWQQEVDKVDQDFKDKSDQATKDEKQKINNREQQGKKDAQGHFDKAEKDASQKKKEAQRDAQKKKDEAKSKSEDEGFFSRIGNAIGDFIDDVKEAVGDIFDALKEAVSFIFDQAKKLAMAAIDLARNAIVGLIKGLGTLLKGFVSVAFAAFPGIAERINSKIDGVVESTTKFINEAAEALKKGVTALLDIVASVIDGLLSVVQGAFNFVMGAMSLIVRGEFDKLGQYIVQSALKLIGATLGALMSALGINEEDVQKIIEDPVKFLGNFVGAIKQGINSFKANIVQHLTSGLLGWLFGTFASAGIQLPTSFNLSSIFSFIAQILNVTYDALRERLVKMLGSNGEAMVSALEKGFAFVQDFITRGPIVLWERVQDALSNLKELLFKPVIEWLRNTIIIRAITKLVAFFNPVGAIIQAIQAIYNVAMFFKERWEQIKSFAQSVFSSIKNIAAGQVASAAGFIEQSMAKAIPIMISFLARLLNIGGIVKKVKEVIETIKRPIDKAVKKVLSWLVGIARKIWAGIKKVAGKLLPKDKKPKTKKERDRQVKEGLRFLHQQEAKVDDDKDKKLTREQAEAAAKKTRKQFPVFGSIKVVDGGTRWDYEYSASSKITEDGKEKEAQSATSGNIDNLIGKQVIQRVQDGPDKELIPAPDGYFYVLDAKSKSMHIQRKGVGKGKAERKVVHIDDKGILQEGRNPNRGKADLEVLAEDYRTMISKLSKLKGVVSEPEWTEPKKQSQIDKLRERFRQAVLDKYGTSIVELDKEVLSSGVIPSPKFNALRGDIFDKYVKIRHPSINKSKPWFERTDDNGLSENREPDGWEGSALIEIKAVEVKSGEEAKGPGGRDRQQMTDYGFIVNPPFIKWHKSETETIKFDKVRYFFNRADVATAWGNDLRRRIGDEKYETKVPR